MNTTPTQTSINMIKETKYLQHLAGTAGLQFSFLSEYHSAVTAGLQLGFSMSDGCSSIFRIYWASLVLHYDSFSNCGENNYPVAERHDEI